MPEAIFNNFLSNSEQVEKLARDVADKVLGEVTYDSNEVPHWVDSITAEILESLQKIEGPFKYIVTAVILQRSNCGFHLFSTCYWDQSQDGVITVHWESKSMHCIITIFGVSI